MTKNFKYKKIEYIFLNCIIYYLNKKILIFVMNIKYEYEYSNHCKIINIFWNNKIKTIEKNNKYIQKK